MTAGVAILKFIITGGVNILEELIFITTAEPHTRDMTVDAK